MKCKYCKSCKQEFFPTQPLQQVCSMDCALKLSKINKDKKAKSEWNKEKKVLKEKTTNWKSSLQIEINKIIRLIDKNLPCLARNRGGQIHSGHIFSRGSNPTIRYNLHNIHRQNAQSNHFQNDDGLLREGLINEYGQEYMDFISNLRRTPALEYKPAEYKDFTLKARKIALQLKKLDLTYSLKNRILIRNKINCELGIYKEEFCIY